MSEQTDRESIVQRSWNAVGEAFYPFSSAALALLPKRLPLRPRSTRNDDIPEVNTGYGEQPTVRDYHAINNVPEDVVVRVPKKFATPIKVEAKVWFANERTWISWLNNAVIIATMAAALFNASQDQVARNFAYFYGFLSLGVLIYGYFIYQKRITMIRHRDPGSFDQVAGPIVVSVLLFFAVLANFVIRVRELKQKNIPVPGEDLINQISSFVDIEAWQVRLMNLLSVGTPIRG